VDLSLVLWSVPAPAEPFETRRLALAENHLAIKKMPSPYFNVIRR
jgi:hypothetical protein